MFNKIKTSLYPGCNIERKAPVNAGNASLPHFLKEVGLEFKPVSLFTYKEVNITPEGIVFRNFRPDPDLFIYPGHRKIYNFLYLLSSFVKRKKIVLPPDEKYLLCFDYWSNSIFHWMCDVLPRLDSVKELAKECILLLPKFYEYPYIHETLSAFQFKGIYLMDDSSYVHCKHLYSPEQIATSGQIRPESIMSLRKTLLAHFKPHFSGKMSYPNLYISRAKAKYRKVINEAELIPILRKYNFELIHFEDFTVSEQIELCYNANNVVSIHGANLTNVIFMQAHKNVLELRKEGDMHNNYFYELSDSVNCNYFYLDCRFEDPEPHKNIFSLYVDQDEFEASLKKITHGG